MKAGEIEDRQYSIAEHLELLANSDVRLEYSGGKITMISGGNRAHSDIADNTFVALRTGKSGCYIKSSDMAVSIQATGAHYFPDISATCEEPEFEPGGITRLKNPSLLIEVLSLSTERKDRGEKFDAYKTLPSFKEYILIDSKSFQIHAYYRKDRGDWQIGNYYRLDQQVEINTLGISVPMSVIYQGVDLGEE
ncbi:Uma2 family endonuclease [Neolewinella persica]|uniref:Uma2 family endonuclease n=1 Tax=Neolewinella persica TaxID=70998 RepID=UPI00035D2774|nr:Uma2 family endonuclease [Neolewinella persica]